MNELKKLDARGLTDLSARAETSGRPTFGSVRERIFGNFRISNDVFSRVFLLFVALCLIKVVMLVGLRKYLFELHWRVTDERDDWVSAVAFYGFAVLVGLAIWRLKTFCAAAGTRTIRL